MTSVLHKFGDYISSKRIWKKNFAPKHQSMGLTKSQRRMRLWITKFTFNVRSLHGCVLILNSILMMTSLLVSPCKMPPPPKPSASCSQLPTQVTVNVREVNIMNWKIWTVVEKELQPQKIYLKYQFTVNWTPQLSLIYPIKNLDNRLYTIFHNWLVSLKVTIKTQYPEEKQ